MSDIFKSDIILPKSEFIAKYKSNYSEDEQRYVKDILFANVKRRRGVTLPDKLSGDIYEIMAYGEGIRESLPKSLVSSGSSKVEYTQMPSSQVIVNSQVSSV